jgi:hypothetical protein
MAERRIKIRDVVEAIRKDGLTKTKGEFFEYDKTGEKIIGGCALGQAALNLSVRTDELWGELPEGFRDRVVVLNDHTNLELPEIATQIEEEFKRFLDDEINIWGVQDYSGVIASGD